jgi:hypothetical protein
MTNPDRRSFLKGGHSDHRGLGAFDMVGGLEVKPGDLVFGDEHGVIQVPHVGRNAQGAGPGSGNGGGIGLPPRKR